MRVKGLLVRIRALKGPTGPETGVTIPVPRLILMSAVLWILQAILAVVFLAVGGMKLAKPKEALLDKMGALENVRPISIKGIGLAEVLGAIGLVLPPLVGLGGLVPWAAFGLACVMVGAMIVHGERGEWKLIAPPALLLVLALVVMYGRSAHVPL